ncbi:MAG: glucose-6-phosphate dehydrogenase [Actinomycetaceae bacterium]|nr:glucose-6-phosphate dehydrogenase [Actinomycetaceae bacterium]
MVDNPLRAVPDSRLQRIAGPCGIVLFGITGDLSRRKILPALYDLANRGLLPPSFTIIGVARRPGEDMVAQVEAAIKNGAKTAVTETTLSQLLKGLTIVAGQYDDEDTYRRLGETMKKMSSERGTNGNYAFYLAIPPELFPMVLSGIGSAGLYSGEDGWRRVVIEKPFGHDLASARELDDVVTRVFNPDSIFRIDHYLGKETVQNLMALRFANELYEPLWNSSHVDHVQITMAEDIGIGTRAGYYDGIGAARDVIQNHLLQLLALTAMEEPTSFEPNALRLEKEKVLEATHFFGPVAESAVSAQYTSGWQGGQWVRGFKEEQGISAESITDTYAAFRLGIETRRWSGVPFYLRAGKRLGRRVTEIAVVFKYPPFLPFGSTEGLGHNALVVHVQPGEGITFKVGSKVPGSAMNLRDVTMDFAYGHAFTEYTPEAYERLILDVLLGDPPLFPQHREIELSWMLVDQAEQYWADHPETLTTYHPGSWGPKAADEMLARDGRSWRLP